MSEPVITLLSALVFIVVDVTAAKVESPLRNVDELAVPDPSLAVGTVPTARLGSGTASSSTFLAGDSSFKTVTGTTINTNADNRVITGSDTANTLNGESNLTFNGTTLDLNGKFENTASAGGDYVAKFQNLTAGTPYTVQIKEPGSPTAGYPLIQVANSDSSTEYFRVDSARGVTKLVMHDGAGIDFSAASGSAAGSASALLDDYEEGIYDGTLSVTSGTLVMNTSINQVSYTKIGRQCTVTGRVNVSSVSGLSGYMTLNLPFAVGTSAEADHAGAGSVFMYGAGGTGSPGYLGLWTMWTDGGNSFVYFTYGDGQSVTAGAKVSAGTGVRFTFTYFTS